MRELRSICSEDIAKIRASLEEYDSRGTLRDQLLCKERDPRPSKYGNRKQRRAARAIGRKENA